jgi:hypothetical protein
LFSLEVIARPSEQILKVRSAVFQRCAGGSIKSALAPGSVREHKTGFATEAEKKINFYLSNRY